MVGYCSPKTLGGQLLSGAKEIELFNEPCTVCAAVDKIDGMSAHGDMDDLLQFVSNQNAEKVKGIFLVHGEPAVQKTFAERLSLKGFKHIECPAMHAEFELPLKQVRKRKRIPVKQPINHTNTIVPIAEEEI